MKNLLLIVLLTLLNSLILPNQDSVSHWKKEGVVGLNISQITLENWSQGGDDALSWTFYSNLGFNYSYDMWRILNKFKLSYGRTKLGTEEYRTNDNEIYLENVVSYNVGWAVDPYFSNTIRSSLSSGFNYKPVPAKQIADFFDPGYITQSMGFTFNKENNFTFRAGLGLQETFTNKFRNYSDDPETKAELEAFKFETGVETVAEGKYTFEENLALNSKLRMFSTFKDIDIWDVRWDNSLTAKVTKYVNVNLNILIIYEKKQTPKTQLKEALQLGIVYNLF